MTDERILPRVLIVDDQPEIARAIARVFSGVAKVIVATSGAEALRSITGGDPGFDLVVCDVMMPGMTGPQLFAQVRAIDARTAAAFVFTTGGVDAEHERELRATGARCLAKPVEVAELRNLLPTAPQDPNPTSEGSRPTSDRASKPEKAT